MTDDRTCLAIVLAAGEGTRMRSTRPKVLRTIASRSLLAHVLDAVRKAFPLTDHQVQLLFEAGRPIAALAEPQREPR